jgi:hypothetical protein
MKTEVALAATLRLSQPDGDAVDRKPARNGFLQAGVDAAADSDGAAE